jgi:hypothetical protein
MKGSDQDPTSNPAASSTLFESFVIPLLAMRLSILSEDKMEEWRICEMRWWVIITRLIRNRGRCIFGQEIQETTAAVTGSFRSLLYTDSVILQTKKSIWV